MANIEPDHLFLAQRPRAVIEIVMNHRPATLVPQGGSRHRRAFQVPSQVLHAVPRPPGFLRKMQHLPVPGVLRLQITAPLALIADVPHAREGAGHDPLLATVQQTDDDTAADGFNLLFFGEQLAPDALFDIEVAMGNGDVDVRMLLELASLGVQGAEDADHDAQLARVPEHGGGGAAKKDVEQRPVVIEDLPQ